MRVDWLAVGLALLNILPLALNVGFAGLRYQQGAMFYMWVHLAACAISLAGVAYFAWKAVTR